MYPTEYPNASGAEWKSYHQCRNQSVPAKHRNIPPDASSCRRRYIATGDAAIQSISQVRHLRRPFFHSFPAKSSRCLAPLHDLEFVTPSLVALAARKIYSHRIVITTARDERSMQYGSDLAAVATMLEGMNPEQVIESVLEEVEVPL